jgi:hypothetical protein
LAEAAVAFHGTVATGDVHFGLPPPTWLLLNGLTTLALSLAVHRQPSWASSRATDAACHSLSLVVDDFDRSTSRSSL